MELQSATFEEIFATIERVPDPAVQRVVAFTVGEQYKPVRIQNKDNK